MLQLVNETLILTPKGKKLFFKNMSKKGGKKTKKSQKTQKYLKKVQKFRQKTQKSLSIKSCKGVGFEC